MESTESSSASQQPHLPPGFRFHPTDEELVVHYLRRKASSAPLPVTIIADIDLYKFDPWELPSKANFGEQEWYFFSPRDRKYPNGARPNRAATSGYWKATGTDKPVLTSGGTQRVGVKKALVFYGGRPPKGIKTNWIMHEYRLTDSSVSGRGISSSSSSSSSSRPPNRETVSKKSSLRLDDWVLCRIYKKNNGCGGNNGGDSHQRLMMERDGENTMSHMLGPALPPASSQPIFHKLLQPPDHKAASTTNYGALLDNDENFFQGLLTEEGLQTTNPTSHVALPSAAISGMLPIKHSPTTTLMYWSEVAQAKRFQGSGSGSSNSSGRDNCSGGNDGSHSIATLLEQVPQGAAHQSSTILGSLGEAVFRQPYQLSGMDWSS